MNLKNVLFQKNIITGYLYFYVHFILEIVCYFILFSLVGNSLLLWIIPFIYDAVAFVPQSLIGYINDKFPNINMGIIGTILLIMGCILFFNNVNVFFSIIILCIGNACIHISGAEVTLKTSNGNLSHSAIFVAGGSFGVITGRLLTKTSLPWWIMIFLSISMIPFILLADCYKKKESSCKKFNYLSEKLNSTSVLYLTFILVIIRGYMGYSLPTSWNQTLFQTFLLYVFMGIGKALGGIFSDMIGARKVALFSTIVGLILLLIGNNFMLISLIGIAIFSMTMPITLGIIVSVLKDTPGLAFGITTIALFIGTIPSFFFTITTTTMKYIVISIFTVLCLFIFSKVLRKEIKNE